MTGKRWIARPAAGNVQPAITAYAKVGAAYEAGRPAYPVEAVDWILEQIGLGPGARVLDLAAGTGKLTRLLLASGMDVVAVEPVEAFREQLLDLRIDARTGTAEKIPLADHTVDAVTVATAFHWFDAARALAEIRRVLIPTGGLAILWNERDPNDQTQRALTALIEPHRRGEPRQSDEVWRAAFDSASGFAPLRERDFLHEHTFTPDTLVARVASISFIAALPDEQRHELLDRVRELGRAHGETFTLPHITHTYLTRALDLEGTLGPTVSSSNDQNDRAKEAG